MKRTLLIFALLCSLPSFGQGILFQASYAQSLGTVATPAFSPDGGSCSGSCSVTITDSTSGSAITYCAATGADCTPSSSYVSAVTVNVNDTHLCAKATKASYADSSIKCATYTIAVAYTDTFAGSALSGNWTSYTGTGFHAPAVGSNQAYNFQGGGANYTTLSAYSAGTFGANQYAQIAFGALATDIGRKYAAPCIHVDASTGNAYCASSTDLHTRITKFTAGVPTDLSGYCPSFSAYDPFTTGQVVKIRNTGSTITVSVNGTDVCSATNNTYTAGSGGFLLGYGNQWASAVSVANFSSGGN